MLRPIQHLPIKPPSEYDPSEEDPDYFYNNFVKHFINDMNRMMCTGLNIDSKAVEELRSTIDNVLAKVDSELSNNPIIERFQEYRYPKIFEEYKTKVLASIRDVDYYYRDYKPTDLTHRSYLVNYYLKEIGREHCCKDKWTVKALKQFNLYHEDKFIVAILDKNLTTTRARAKGAMLQLAKDKVAIWNLVRTNKVDEGIEVPPFNPASSKQKIEMFQMLKIEPLAETKKGNDSWGREQLEELCNMSSEGDLKNILQSLIDHSYSAIIKGNFLKAFDTYTVDGVLHGNVKLGGAKSWRNTSNNPNMLNMPSSGSIYAKPLKKCFVAPEGMIVIQADFSSLEDVILANLTKDEGKLAIQKDKTLDAHCYNALGYFRKEVDSILGNCSDYKEQVRKFKTAVKEGNKELKTIRGDSKSITFKLAYLGYPDADKGGSITQEVYDNYHEVLYPDVKRYLDEYVIPVAKEQGYLHLGLGARLYVSGIDESFRTMFNANFQFWSILTLIAINEMNYRIDQKGYQDKIQITSTIYDSIYANIAAEPEIIKWYNDNLVEIGKTDFLIDQEVPNTLECAIGNNWSQELDLPPDASVKEIINTLAKIDKTY